MFEINYEMTTRFDNQVDEVLCCSCYYDEVYFLLRQKVNDEIFEEKFERYDDCFMTFFDGIIIVVCIDILKFVRDKKQ